MEYLLVASFVFLMTVPLVAVFYQESIAFNNEISVSQTYKALNKLTDSANTVYYLGSPSRRTITVYFPENIKNITVADDSITATLGVGNDFVISSTSEAQLNGSISTGSGLHEIQLEAKGAFVQIS